MLVVKLDIRKHRFATEPNLLDYQCGAPIRSFLRQLRVALVHLSMDCVYITSNCFDHASTKLLFITSICWLPICGSCQNWYYFTFKMEGCRGFFYWTLRSKNSEWKTCAVARAKSITSLNFGRSLIWHEATKGHKKKYSDLTHHLYTKRSHSLSHCV